MLDYAARYMYNLHKNATTSLWHIAVVSKVEKVVKNRLTKGERGDIMYKLSTRAVKKESWKKVKKTQKTFEKPLDKADWVWYNSKAVQNAANWSLTIEQQEIEVQA